MLPRPRPQPQNGFSLIELLITLVVLTVVLASFSRILRTENQLSTQTARNLAIRDSLTQASDLMRREIAMASRLTTDLNTLPNASICKSSPTPALVLIGPNNAWQISYGLRTASTAEMTNDWFGPGLLIRCGPPYSASLGTTGSLNATGTIAQTVMLDRLNSSTGFSVSLGTGSFVNQSASITLNLVNDLGSAITSSFQTGIAANSLYNTPNYPNISCPAGSAPNNYKCNDSTDDRDNYVLPTSFLGTSSTPTLTITGDASKEVAIYFPSTQASYNIPSGQCNTTQCTVGNLTLRSFSLLVFTDTEIRLPTQ